MVLLQKKGVKSCPDSCNGRLQTCLPAQHPGQAGHGAGGWRSEAQSCEAEFWLPMLHGRPGSKNLSSQSAISALKASEASDGICFCFAFFIFSFRSRKSGSEARAITGVMELPGFTKVTGSAPKSQLAGAQGVSSPPWEGSMGKLQQEPPKNPLE